MSDFGCFDVVFDDVELLMEFVWMVMGYFEVKLFHWQEKQLPVTVFTTTFTTNDAFFLEVK